MFHNSISRYGLCLLLISCILLSSACDKKHEEVVLDNPFDPDNPETHGNPYNMTTEIKADGVSVKWNDIPNIDGVDVYRSTSADGEFVKVGASTTGEYTDTDIQSGETYYYQLRAYRDDTSAPHAISPNSIFIPDTTPPAGTGIIINGGADVTGNRSVTLSLSATDANEMRVSNSRTFADTWETYATSKTWTLPSGDGEKVVFAQFRNSGGNVSDVVSASIALDTKSPEGSITINGGASVTNNPKVTLELSSDDASEMRISNSQIFTDTWEAYAASKTWTLPPGDGDKTVYAQFRDAAGNVSDAVSDRISLDTEKPGITINNGARFTNSRSVTLTLSAGAAAGMRISNGSIFAGAWEIYATTKTWTLPSGDGDKTVFAQFRDAAGSVSSTVSASITLDTKAPTGNITINGGASSTSSTSVTLDLSSDDAAEMRISNSDKLTDSWQAYRSTISWMLTFGDGTKTVYAQFRDTAGNESDIAEASINLRDLSDAMEGKDGSKMALIPAGDFQMGDAFNEGDGDELPVHKVHIDAFYMDINEVTNAQYARFLNEYGKETDADGNELLDLNSKYGHIQRIRDTYSVQVGYEDYPVIEVSWHGAAAYAEFYDKRLPTEAEWEKAARGGLAGKRYPWGDALTHNDANYSGTGGKDVWDTTAAPVGSFDPNGYGLYDVAGNVWEWCADWYDSGYYVNPPERNPTGPNLGTLRVLRGGSRAYNTSYLRVANRHYDAPGNTGSTFGFRCVVQQWAISIDL